MSIKTELHNLLTLDLKLAAAPRAEFACELCRGLSSGEPGAGLLLLWPFVGQVLKPVKARIARCLSQNITYVLYMRTSQTNLWSHTC